MLEVFLKKNWRSVLLLVALLFAWLVWPTPYKNWMESKKDSDYMRYMRMNRFTGKYEAYWFSLGEWRLWDSKSWDQASEDADRLDKAEKEKKKAVQPQSKK